MGKTKFRFALNAFLWHFAGSAFITLLASLVVFWFWYPQPYASLLKGGALFFLVVTVDVVCGPLLTLVLFNPQKTKRELTLDLGVVACLQAAALVYGLHAMWVARPVYLAYELDRFRVITLADIAPKNISKIPPEIGPPGWRGPKMVGIRVAQPVDADYLEQVQLSINGQDAAFRIDRWAPYDGFHAQLITRSRALPELYARHPGSPGIINAAVMKTGRASAQLRWLPVQSRRGTGWTVFIDTENATVAGWVQLDSF